MCLAAWSIAPTASSSRYPWLIASNRDEFHDRPTAPLAWWRPEGAEADVLSGRDLMAGGTWLGVTAQGRLALVTNVREPGRHDPAAASRGALVLQGLAHGPQDAEWLQAALQVPRNGYNLLLADLRADRAVWASNRAAAPVAMAAGVHGVSNALLDTPWPKLEQLKQAVADGLQAPGGVEGLIESSLQALARRDTAPDAALPRTGIPLARERQLGSAFIHIPGEAGSPLGAYGTRCSTVIVVEPAAVGRRVHMVERRFDAEGAVVGTRREVFEIA